MATSIFASFIVSLSLLFSLANGQYITRTSYFEVFKPIPKPVGAKRCSVSVLKNYVYGRIPFSSIVDPPTQCGKTWSLVTLSWAAFATTNSYFAGRGNIFIDGINIDKPPAIIGLARHADGAEAKWSFEEDITKYVSYLKQKRRLVVDFRLSDYPNSNSRLTLNLTLNYYAGGTPSTIADAIVPLSPKSAPNAPFNLTHKSNKGRVSLSGLPRNVYRAEVEIFQLSGGSDRLYWENFPENFLIALPPAFKTSFNGGGSFRETLVYVDGLLAGATWQFPVVQNGFIDPVMAIGDLLTPSYKIDVTPFVGLLVNGKSHNITFAVEKPSKNGYWEVSGALHLWLDKKSKQTSGHLISRQIKDNLVPLETFQLDAKYGVGNATTQVKRTSKIVGTVSTSFGTFTATSSSSLNFLSTIRKFNPELVLRGTTILKVGGTNIVEFKFKNGGQVFYRSEVFSFPLNFTQINVERNSGITDYLSLGFIKNITTQYGKGKVMRETLSNTQSGSNTYYLGLPGPVEYQQRYVYRSNFAGCYYRKITSSDVNNDSARSTC